MELTVIILNWNAADDTIRCIRRLTTWQRLQPAIVVVDNASTDDSCKLIAGECPQARLICNPTNQGFAGGNNRGIEASLGLSEAPLLLLNNDALLEEEDAFRLLATLRADPKIGLIGPLLYDADCRDRLLSAGSKDPSQHHHSHNHQLPGAGSLQTVECIPGTVIMIRAEVFRTAGLLDEAYFFGSEIADLCLLARQYGYLSVIDTRARAFHTLKRSSKFRESLYPYYIIRNRFLVVRKFHRRLKIFYYSFWTFYGLALLLKVRLAGQLPLARSVWLGLLDGLRGRFGDQNERVLASVFGSKGKGERS
ncbi:MAG: glycosyltransferase family 2 protein [Chloroflexota bacterium]